MNNRHLIIDTTLITTSQNYYYECYINEQNKFCYNETQVGKHNRFETSRIIEIHRSIPKFLHKMILYYHYIPSFLS